MLLGLADWPLPDRTVEFPGLILAAILTSAVVMRQFTTRDWATMPLSFVIDFTSLLLLGPNATMLVSTAGTVTAGLTGSQYANPIRMVLTAATGLVAIQAAGLAHQSLGGTMGHFVWPDQGVPIAAAILAYCFVKGVLADIVVPFCTKQPINRSFLKNILRGCPNYCIGASLAVGFVEVIDDRNWQVALVAAAPLYFAYRAYCAHVNSLEDDHRRREVIESLDEGMSLRRQQRPGDALE